MSNNINVIKILFNEVNRLTREDERVRQSLYQAQCDVQRLEAGKKGAREKLEQATKALEEYAPDWRKRLNAEFWKDY